MLLKCARAKEYRLTMKLVQLGHAAINSDVTGTVKKSALPLWAAHKRCEWDGEDFLSLTLTTSSSKISFEQPVNSAFRTRTYVDAASLCTALPLVNATSPFSSDAVRETYWQRNVSTMKPLTENTILDKSPVFDVLDKIKRAIYMHWTMKRRERSGHFLCCCPYFRQEQIPCIRGKMSLH